ncbi:hypothetical protein [Lysinibacillus sp. 54212]|uniref:hypothetical protein n=1 Tax=Lysinibacillus sp. 54212 TaxID=3119829 RepID=UPI002FCA30DF
MRKWFIIFLLVLIGGTLFYSLQDQKKYKHVAHILDSIPSIDSIQIIDGKAEKTLLQFDNSSNIFHEMVNIYSSPYVEMKWSEQKIIRKEPYAVVQFFGDNEIKYRVNIYRINKEEKDLLENNSLKNESLHKNPLILEEKNNTYIFAIKENDHILGINDGLKKIIYSLIDSTS